MPVAILALAAILAYDRFGPARDAPPAPIPGPVVPSDPSVVALGAAYRSAMAGAGLAALRAVESSGAASTADLARGQRDALDAGLKAAWSPVAAELTRRFGAVDAEAAPSRADGVRAFYRDLAAGYGKGAQ